jgi:hypothetical protein
MKIYNFFSNQIELNQYLKKNLYAKGIYSMTNVDQPFLSEIPILISIGLESSTDDICISALVNNRVKKENWLPKFKVESTSIQEDIVSFENESHRITLQAMNDQEAMIVWQIKQENHLRIFFSGKAIHKNQHYQKVKKLLGFEFF